MALNNNDLPPYFSFLKTDVPVENIKKDINKLLLKVSVSKQIYTKYDENWKIIKGTEKCNDQQYLSIIENLLGFTQKGHDLAVGEKWKIINAVHSIIDKFINEKSSPNISDIQNRLVKIKEEVGHA